MTIQTFLFTGAAAASRVFNEALAKIAMNAQQGGTTDIGELFIFCSLFNEFIKCIQHHSGHNFTQSTAILMQNHKITKPFPV